MRTKKDFYGLARIRAYIYIIRKLKNSNPSLLPVLGEVSDIKEDKKGGVWIISNSNLFHYDPASAKIKPYKLDFGRHRFFAGISRDSSIWVSTTTAALKKYIPAYDNFITWAILKIPGKKESVQIQKIYALNNGNLLVGTLSQGVKLFECSQDISGHCQCKS